MLDELGVPLHRSTEVAAYVVAFPLGMLHQFGIYALLPMATVLVMARRRFRQRPVACCVCGRHRVPIRVRHVLDGLQYVAMGVAGLRIFSRLVELIAR